MKKSFNSILSLLAIFISFFLASCASQTRLPSNGQKALESYWQSLPSYPNITYQILHAWPGATTAETITPWAPNMEVWCVETEIIAAEDSSIIGGTVTWILMRNDKKANWTATMLAMMSSIWPYEACGEAP